VGPADRALGLRALRLGCNTIPGERYGTLRRIRNRYNHEVNGYFLCDRGRFGYEFVNMVALAEEIAQALRVAERPLVISGTSLGSEALLHAAADIARALSASGRPAEISLVVPECNSLGLGLLGGQDLEAALQALRSEGADMLVVLENDLFRRAPAGLVEGLLEAAPELVVVDHLESPTASRATVALPAATFAESDGTFVNNEGRAQRFYQVFVPSGWVQESWRWFRDILRAAGSTQAQGWENLEALLAAMAAELPAFAPIASVDPPADFRLAGRKIPRQPHRYSGRTAIFSSQIIHEPQPPEDVDAPFTFSMEGYKGKPPGNLIPRYWEPGWNSVQALNKFQSEVGGELIGGDPGLRLLEPPAEARGAYYGRPPAAFQAGEEGWLLVPLYHIYGSEELSSQSPPVTELIPEPYLALNPADAGALGLGSIQPLKETFHSSAQPGEDQPEYASQHHALKGEPPPYDEASPGELSLREWARRGGPGQDNREDGTDGPENRPSPRPPQETVQVVLGEQTLTLPVKIDASLPPRVAGLPAGLPGLSYPPEALPALVRLSRVRQEAGGGA
jgi:hypothetical protein